MSKFGLAVYSVLETGLDRHVWDRPLGTAGKSGLIGWIATLLFLASSSCTKISILVFFLRLLDRHIHRELYWTVIVAISFIGVSFVAFSLLTILSCNPVQAAWMSLDVTWPVAYNCNGRKMADLLNGIFSISTDVFSVVLPVLIVRRLQISQKQKIILYGVFCCGLAVVGAAIARTFYSRRMYTDKNGDISCTWSSPSNL
jgi:hypothetical protein